MDIIEYLGLFAAIVGLLFTFITLLDFRNKSLKKKEDEEIDTEINNIVSLIDDQDKDVLLLMIKNVAELREYYVMNKQQARNSFSAALTMSILGFLIFSAGIILPIFDSGQQDSITYSTISGAIVEVVAGLFFWLYSKAINQINIFHTSLQHTEKFLTAIQLVEKMSQEKRDDSYQQIITKIIDFNFESK